jgi:hypothetical protein
MTPEARDLKAENAVLRGTLWMVARALRDYQDAPHVEIDDDGRPMLKLIVSESLREKAKAAFDRAEKLLREPERGRAS